MNIVAHENFNKCHAHVKQLLKDVANLVDAGTWQSIPTAGKPEMITHEVEDIVLQYPIFTEDLDYHRTDIHPNLPWADHHFEKDRVSGEPLNPGLTWQDWPYANKANEFRTITRYDMPQFNHTYAERYWPKRAGYFPLGKVRYKEETPNDRHGIRSPYGDLIDLVNHLVKNPGTRAAYLPVWFPEDTGVVHEGRVPCSLGYLFRMRDHRLSIAYYIRSCDFLRHFPDDVYLTVRLLLWVLDECRKRSNRWTLVAPGDFFMHVGSMHVFRNDYVKMFGVKKS